MEIDIAGAIKDFGFPVIAAFGMGYFIFFIWKWVTETIDPVIGASMGTLIKLVDRVRMLDNDMIRLNTQARPTKEYRCWKKVISASKSNGNPPWIKLLMFYGSTVMFIVLLSLVF